MNCRELGGSIWTRFGGLSLIALVLSTSVFATEMQHFAVRQVRQIDLGAPAVRAYLDLRDSEGDPIEQLSSESLGATLGEWVADLDELRPFDPQHQGVAYVFLVDISRSLSPQLFQQVMSGLEEWIASLSPLDRAAILSFGDQSRLVVDYSRDTSQLSRQLAALGPTDDWTVLHQALIDALELSRRLDPDLPGRRAIVVFSDGKDEGSSTTADDVLDRFGEDPVPIYALGFSRLSDPDERRRYLALLDRFATNSGGSSFEVRETRFSEAYEAIRAAIEGVWVADFVCQSCRPDGTVRRLQVRVEQDGRVLTDGGPVRLLPLLTAQADPSGSIAPTDGPIRGEPAPEPDPEATSAARRSASDSVETGAARTVSIVVGLVLAAIVLMAGMRRRAASKRRAEAATRLQQDLLRHDSQPLDPEVPPPARAAPASGAMDATRGGQQARRARSGAARPRSSAPQDTTSGPLATKAVRLVVIRGSRQSRQYNFVVRGTAIIGRRSDCDCVLVDEPEIDAQQFELHYDGVRMYVRNLSATHPTLLNGQTIAGRAQIASNTLIGTDATILRVVYE